MSHFHHFRDQIGCVQQRGMRAAAGDHHVLASRTLTQRRHHVVDVDPAPGDRIRELVEYVKVVPLLGEAALDLGPPLCGSGRVVGFRARLARPRPP